MTDVNPNMGRRMTNAAAAPLNYMGSAAGTMIHKGGIYWVWLSMMLYAFDWFFLGFNGINFKNVLNSISSGGTTFIIGAIFNTLVLIILVFYIFFGKHTKEEIISFAVAVMMSSLILTMTSFNISSIVHLVFAWFMWSGLFKKAMPSQDANFMLAIILFIDFFAFSIISSFGGLTFFNRLIIPVHFLFSLNYTQESGFKSFLVTLVVIFYVLQVSSTFYTYQDFTESLGTNDKITAKQSVNKAIDNLMGIYTKTKLNIEGEVKDYVNDTKNDLQGTTYQSEIDAKSKQDLGIELKDVGKDDIKRYNTGDDIKVTGILKGRTLSDFDKVKVLVTCYGIRSIDTKTKINGTVLNEKVYEVNMGLYEEQYIDCHINNASKGDWTIYFEAVFNFTSQGYLKTYYMDKDRYISLRSQNIDVFANYQIRDTKPVSKSINGPGKMAIVTAAPPGLIPSNTSERFGSYVGVSITNNWQGGKLNKVWDIKLTIPYGLALSNCEDRFYEVSSDSTMKESIYSLQDGYVAKTLNLTLVGDVRSEKCSLNLTSTEELLGESPFSTRYFKAESTYEYLLKRSTTVNVYDQKK